MPTSFRINFSSHGDHQNISSNIWFLQLHDTNLIAFISQKDKNVWFFNYHLLTCSFDALAQGNAYKPAKEPLIIVDPAGMEFTTSRLGQLRQLPVAQHSRFMPLKLCQKHNYNDMPGAALDNWQPARNA